MRSRVKEQPALRGLSPRLGWDEVVAALERVKGERRGAFRNRHGDWGRDLALYVARRRGGMTLKELGQAVGGLDYRRVGWAVRQAERRRQRDAQWRRRLRQVEEEIQKPDLTPLALLVGRWQPEGQAASRLPGGFTVPAKALFQPH